MYDVIDISHWNGNIDFNRVKEAGIKGVIIKAGGSDGAKKYYVDNKFEENYRKSKEAGLLVGAYWFSGSQINTMAMGIYDAMNFYNTIKGKQFELPVFMDYEVGDKRNKDRNTDAVVSFCHYMEDKKYYAGVYGSDINTFKEMVNLDRLKSYYLWVARYGTEPVTRHNMWQYTSKGKVSGVNGNVDMNHVYTDTSEVVKRLGLNGFSQLN